MRVEFSGGFLVVEPVAEGGFEYLTTEDRQTAATFRNEARRLQWLTWRNIARRELGIGAPIEYSADGAPQLSATVNGIGFLSVSHTRQSVAVMFSERSCGIDIEECERNFERVAKRYITPAEERFAEALGKSWQSVLWCAKEAIFKYGHRAGVDFLTDVTVASVDNERSYMTARFFGRPTPEIHYSRLSGEMLCWLTE